ncbi:MAG: hypothetical protein QOE90_1384 [Thermoplasmata archaeon]|nr:hypothetical protein [Thermoplasmata archaeon]
MPAPPEDFGALWRERLASGSKLSAKALAQALKEDGGRLAKVAPLLKDPLSSVRVSTLRAFEEIARGKPQLVAPYAQPIIEALGASEPDAQASALSALASIAHLARPEAALALPLIRDVLDHAKRPALREEAARALGRIGAEMPERAGDAAHQLAHALGQAKSPRAAQEAREILAAIEGLLPHLTLEARAELGPAVAPMRGHPNIQVRERAGRLAKALAA